MAAKTPDAYGSAATVGDPNLMIPLYDLASSVTPTQLVPALGLTHQCFHFADIDAADTWTSGIRGIVSFAWSNEGLGGVACALSDAATGTVALSGSSSNRVGWLHVWSRG